MTEGAPTLKSSESFADKKAKVLAYIKQELEKQKLALADLSGEVTYYENYKPAPLPISGRMPSTIERGSADEMDWIVETESGRYEEQQRDYFTSREVRDRLHHLELRVEELEESLPDLEKGDEKEIDYYWEEMQKSTK